MQNRWLSGEDSRITSGSGKQNKRERKPCERARSVRHAENGGARIKPILQHYLNFYNLSRYCSSFDQNGERLDQT